MIGAKYPLQFDQVEYPCNFSYLACQSSPDHLRLLYQAQYFIFETKTQYFRCNQLFDGQSKELFHYKIKQGNIQCQRNSSELKSR